MIDKSYNNVIDALSCVAYSQGFVKSVSTGNIDDIDTSGGVDGNSTLYPLVHIVPQGVVAGTGTLSFNFNILAMDLVQPDSSNEQDVLSDTLSIITSIISEFRHGKNLEIAPDNKGVLAQISEDVSIEPFTEYLDNVVSGWNASFNIEIPFQYKACDSNNISIDSNSDFLISNAKICTKFINNPLRIPFTGDTEGPELIINGDFATDSDWTKGSGWTISGGSASHTGGASYLSQDVLQANTLYKVSINITAVSGGFVQIYMGNSPASVLISVIGNYTYNFTSQSVTTLGFALRSLGDITIDNVSVKELP